VTVEQLLSHTSGIPDFLGLPDFDWLKPTNTAQLVALFSEKPLTSRPGTSFEYSNSNFTVLGVILERVTGRSFETHLKTEILIPAGMHDTFLPSSGKLSQVAKAHPNLQRGMAFGTEVSPGPSPDINVGCLGAAGGLVSTAADLLKWNTFLFGGDFLRPETLVDMQTRRLEDYGLGLIAEDYPNGSSLRGHAGGLPGYKSEDYYLPKDQLSLVVLSNVQEVGTEVSQGLLGALIGETVVTATGASTTPALKQAHDLRRV